METATWANFLTVYSVTACAGTLALGLRRRGKGRAWRIGGSLLLAAGGVAVASFASPGRNVPLQILRDLLALDRTQVVFVGATSLCGLLAGVGLTGFVEYRWQRGAALALYAAAMLGFSALAAKDRISPYLADPEASGAAGLVQQEVVAGFRVEKIAALDVSPTCLVAGPAGDLLIGGYAGIAFQNGVVVRIDLRKSADAVQPRVVARYLNRPHGLAFHNGDLYVSRSGQYSRAVEGVIQQVNTGAITRLQDLDSDGVYEHYVDVVSDLPGGQLPDGLHTNNGIVFDAEGRMYITAGAPSDHGPSVHAYAGTILRCAADGSDLNVLARGLRNPFDLTFGPDGQLFGTDNDANSRGGGDELNHIVPGGHFGHPYAVSGRLDVSGIVPPIARLSSAQGLAFAAPGTLPAGFDNCLYVASYGDDRVNRVELTRRENSYEAKVTFFARVPNPVDLVVVDQAVYVCSHHDKALYCIRPE